jgi:soluble lytic murein transglycosylase
LLLGCTRLSHGEPAQHDAVLLSHSVPAAAPESKPAAPERPWVELLRMERWAEALALIEAEPAEVQQEPLVRLAKGVAAQRVNESERSLKALNELDGELPELGERVLRVRAEANLSSGDFRQAEAYYRARSDAPSRLRACEALAKLGERDAARGLLDTLLKKVPPRSLCSIEAPAHRMRASLLPDDALAAKAAEYRWLLVEAPLCASSEDVEPLLNELPEAYRLKASERLARARSFAEAGRVEHVEHELELCGPGAEKPAGTREHLRGLARLRARRELPHAAELLCRAAAQSAGSAAERKFLAARAHERNGDDDAAHALYQEVARGYPGSSFAEHATYRNAQLAFAAGKFDAALSAYDAYLKRYGVRGRHARDARDARAVCLLALGRAASKELRALFDSATDERVRLRYLELEGVALLREGKTDLARARFTEVAQRAPLSFFALMANARLEAMGAPPLMPAPRATPPDARFEAELPGAAALLHRVGLDREAESALGEAEASVLRDYAGRGNRALCELYGQLAPAERRYRWGQRVATAEELSETPSPDRRWLWECVYPRPYSSLVTQLGDENGVEAEFIYAVMRQESAFRPEAASGAQAQGLLQLIPSTASKLAAELDISDPVDLRRPPENVRLGVYYLRKLEGWFANNLALTAAGYNAGPVAVLRWLRGSPNLELDVFVARIPYDETRTYVERVLSNYARYRYLAGDSEPLRLALNLPEANVDGADLY